MKGKYHKKRKLSKSYKRIIQRKLIIFFVAIGTLAIIVACGILFLDNGSKIASGIFAESSETEDEESSEAENEESSEVEDEESSEAEDEESSEAENEESSEVEDEESSEAEDEESLEVENEQSSEAENEESSEAEDEQSSEAENEESSEVENEEPSEAEDEKSSEAEDEESSEAENEESSEAEDEESSEAEDEESSEAADEESSEAADEESSEAEDEESSETNAHIISGVSGTCQFPELPTGCEATALYSLMKYWEIQVNKYDLAMNYMPREYVYFEKGSFYGPNPMDTFAGDPSTESGSFGCFAKCLVKTFERFALENQEANEFFAIDLTGKCLDYLLQEYVAKDNPVLVIVTPRLVYPHYGCSWMLENGETWDWQSGHHAMVVYGFNENEIYVTDSANWSGMATYNRKEFEEIYKIKGLSAMTILLSNKKGQ